VPWLALVVDVQAWQADALGDALMAQGAQSVWLERPGEPVNRLHALLEAQADPQLALAQAADAAGISLPAFRTHPVADEDWVRATQSQFAPRCIAGRLWIVPSWHEPPGEGVVLRLDPGLAFGTGSHPSTRLVLGWLAGQVLAGARVLDYGCGSGILAIAAAKLGAARVDAVDVDADALAATGDNARANGVEVRACAPEALAPGDYDIVLANILAQPLIVLEPLLAARVRAGGRILLSGILDAQAAEVAAAYDAHFATRVAAEEEGWALVEGRRR
jgi:ribosomal protein L11 methyltransferase